MIQTSLLLPPAIPGTPDTPNTSTTSAGPVGDATTTSPAHAAPRPALRLLSPSLPATLRGRLLSGRDLLPRERAASDDPPLATAVPALDRLLAGGLLRGQLVELVGGRSSGRFATVLSALAAVTGGGEPAALVDLGDCLEPRLAATLGVDLELLLWLRPPRLKQALASVEMLLACRFPLVVLDLGLPPLRGGRGAEGCWLRLAHAARERRTALLVASPYRLSGTAAAVVVEARRGQPRWRGRGLAPRLLDGLEGHLVVEKRRGHRAGQGADLCLAAPEQLAGMPAVDLVPPAHRPGELSAPPLAPLVPTWWPAQALAAS